MYENQQHRMNLEGGIGGGGGMTALRIIGDGMLPLKGCGGGGGVIEGEADVIMETVVRKSRPPMASVEYLML